MDFFFSSIQTASYTITEIAKLKAIKHFLNCIKLMHLVLQSAASWQMNAVSANSPVTGKFQREMMKFTSEALEAVQEDLFFIINFPLPSSTRMQLVRCVFDKRECQHQEFLWQKNSFEKQLLPTHLLTQHHLLQHLHILAFDFITPEEYSCLTVSKTRSKNIFKAAVA